MKFKGTIIITDPCYIVKKAYSDKQKPVITDYMSPEYLFIPCNKLTGDVKIGYDKYEEDYLIWKQSIVDDWNTCQYGENMEKLGINTYITKDNKYGDWSCTTLNDNGDVLGEFCAVAGLVSVFLLDEVRKYNPDIDVWIEEHNHFVTKIEDFDGDIEITYSEIEYDGDIEIEVSVIGKGNINFFTTNNEY